MKFRTTKRLNMNLSEIGFGGWQLGNKENWTDMSFSDGVALVKEAYERGINIFDTAPNYAEGMSEEILGEALKDVRERVFINTKFGHSKEGMDFSEEAIEKSIKSSMERLKTKYLDSVILHNPPKEILMGKTNHESVFKSLKAQGMIKHWGVSIDHLEELQLVLDSLDVDVIELMFNINHQEVKHLFNEIKKRSIILIIKIPLDSGWLTGKYDESSTFEGIRSRWSKEDILVRANIIKKIKDIVKQDDLVPVAISFILSFSAVTAVIPGIRKQSHLNSCIDASRYMIHPNTKKALEDLYETLIAPLNIPW